MRFLRIGAAGVLVALLVGGSAAHADQSAEILDAPLPPREWTFSPALIEIKAGEYVTWSNAGMDAHDVTTEDQVISSGTLLPGEGFSFYFEAPGEYAYYCTLHPWMTGKVVVHAGAASPEELTVEEQPE